MIRKRKKFFNSRARWKVCWVGSMETMRRSRKAATASKKNINKSENKKKATRVLAVNQRKSNKQKKTVQV
jgi:hypothetical protein